MSEHLKILNLPEYERPYEKYRKLGCESLTDAELLAIIINNGTKNKTSLEVARDLLNQKHGNLLNIYDYAYEDLLKVEGIGKVKAIQIKAIAELSRRIAKTKSGYSIQMKNPSSIAAYYMEELRHQKQEFLIGSYFDAKCNFLGDARVSMGSVNYAYVSPRDIFRKALEKNAVFVVLLHNHPSGDPDPSEDDYRVTKRIKSCGEMIGIELEDHIIIGDNQYFSFKEQLII